MPPASQILSSILSVLSAPLRHTNEFIRSMIIRANSGTATEAAGGTTSRRRIVHCNDLIKTLETVTKERNLANEEELHLAIMQLANVVALTDAYLAREMNESRTTVMLLTGNLWRYIEQHVFIIRLGQEQICSRWGDHGRMLLASLMMMKYIVYRIDTASAGLLRYPPLAFLFTKNRLSRRFLSMCLSKLHMLNREMMIFWKKPFDPRNLWGISSKEDLIQTTISDRCTGCTRNLLTSSIAIVLVSHCVHLYCENCIAALKHRRWVTLWGCEGIFIYRWHALWVISIQSQQISMAEVCSGIWK